jgi:hypothetical protein
MGIAKDLGLPTKFVILSFFCEGSCGWTTWRNIFAWAGGRKILRSAQNDNIAQNDNKQVILSLLAKDLAFGEPNENLTGQSSRYRFFAPLRMTNFPQNDRNVRTQYASSRLRPE